MMVRARFSSLRGLLCAHVGATLSTTARGRLRSHILRTFMVVPEMAAVAAGRRLGYTGVSGIFLAVALAAFAVADVKITALDPWGDLLRLLKSLVRPDVLAIDARSMANTVAFAVTRVGVGASLGFALALLFARLRAIRAVAAFLRS